MLQEVIVKGIFLIFDLEFRSPGPMTQPAQHYYDIVLISTQERFTKEQYCN